MQIFHAIRLAVAIVAAVACAAALVQSDPDFFEFLFVVLGCIVAMANARGLVGTWQREWQAMGFSYMLFPTNLYGALIGMMYIKLASGVRDAPAGELAINLCLAVGALFFVPVLKVFEVGDVPAFQRGGRQGLVFFLVMTVLTVAIMGWAIA